MVKDAYGERPVEKEQERHQHQAETKKANERVPLRGGREVLTVCDGRVWPEGEDRGG